MRNIKAQGMSMNVIIIAALAIIVLIILVVVMTGRFNLFGTTTRNCEAHQGFCRERCLDGEAAMMMTDCIDNEDGRTTCCIPTYGQVDEDRRITHDTARPEG